MTIFPGSLQGRGDMLLATEVVHIPALPEPFVVKDHFIPQRFIGQEHQVRSKVSKSTVKIVSFDKYFCDNFLDMVEGPMDAITLQSAELLFGASEKRSLFLCGSSFSSSKSSLTVNRGCCI